MRKHFIQKIAILSLMLAMSQTMPVLCSEQLSEEISENSMENKEDINQSQEEELTISEKELTDKNAQETNSQNEVNETGWGDNAGSYSDENSGNINEEDIPKPEVQNEELDESDIIGWSQQGEDWYYFDAPGSKAYGWRLLGNVWYYFDKDNVEKPGIMLSSTRRVINGEVFFFGESGAMRKGWIVEPEGWYYAKENGAMATGWQWIGNAWYYLDGDNDLYPGLMKRDSKEVIGNATYFFQPSGAMITGWALRPEGWYYANAYGAMVTGWQQIGSTWYYLDGENSEYPGLMLADCKKVFGDITYFFERSGKMATGWTVRPEGRYYTNPYGAMVTGWQQIGSTWYYLDGENSEYPGLMAADTKKVIEDSTYFFKESGEMVTGWALRPEGWYYTNKYGAMITGWQQIGSSWFYLDMENTSVSENVKNIMGYVTSHPGCKRADIYKALIPGYEDAISQIPENIINPTEKKEKEVIQSTETESSVENGAEEKKDAKDEPQSTSVSAPELPEEVSSNLANLNADLHWLIQCGHVIEFYKGNIEPAPKKIAPPSPKPKEKKDSAKNKKKEEKENTGKTEVQNNSSEEEMDSNASGTPVTSIEKDQVKPVIPTSEMEQPIESNTESNQSTEETSSVIPPKSEEKEN